MSILSRSSMHEALPARERQGPASSGHSAMVVKWTSATGRVAS